tara:strand:+ start:573 stop:770 length:198 start_codon:yes stop_codon:yes gene_type:complete
MDEDILETHKTYNKLTSELILSGVDPILIAGILSASGINLYKINMNRESFLNMMDMIYTEAIKDI